MKRIALLLIAIILATDIDRTTALATTLFKRVAQATTKLQGVASATTEETNNTKQPEKQHNTQLQLADSIKIVSQRLEIEPSWLINTMQAESGLKPDATNKIGATGLIQFKVATAIDLGTTTEELRKMTAIEQLVYVEKFYKKATGRINSESDLRLFTFFPLALEKNDDFVLESELLPAKEVATRNPFFDTNGDMKITKGEYLSQIK